MQTDQDWYGGYFLPQHPSTWLQPQSHAIMGLRQLSYPGCQPEGGQAQGQRDASQLD